MANEIIRQKANEKGVKLWQIADMLGIYDASLSRKLRTELPENERKKILSIIDVIANGGSVFSGVISEKEKDNQIRKIDKNENEFLKLLRESYADIYGFCKGIDGLGFCRDTALAVASDNLVTAAALLFYKGDNEYLKEKIIDVIFDYFNSRIELTDALIAIYKLETNIK